QRPVRPAAADPPPPPAARRARDEGSGMTRYDHAGDPVVDIRDLHITFATDGEPVHAVDGVSLHVDPGEVLAVVGESGSGKTVTAKSVLGLLPEHALVEGTVVLAGQDVVRLRPAELRR